jgi:serine/threonine protein kinase
MAVRIEKEAEPIPGYKLLERLGGGGFGEVWKASAPGGLLKAIKFVYGDLQGGEQGQRAEQELKAMSRVKAVRHPYILSLERYDIIDNQLVIVMELADRNLWDRFRECRREGAAGIPREELLRYMEETAEGLDLMNIQHQLQHLDIKPQNIFLVQNHAKVADFGLVKDLEGMMASVTGGVTPVYAAPETFDGWVSRFCDQYSLAILYQELLTGQRPFAGSNVRQLIQQHLTTAPNLSSLPDGDRPAIRRALSKNPDDRFFSCQDLVRALKASEAANGKILRSHRDMAPKPHKTPAPREEDGPHTEAGRSSGLSVPEGEGTCWSVPASESQPVEAPGQTCWINVLDNCMAAELPDEPVVYQSIEGEGVLFPSLVVGVGYAGLISLQKARERFAAEFGSLDAMPQIRWVYVDTDSEDVRTAARGPAGTALTLNEIVHAKLNRPSHYLKAKDGRGRIDDWFNLKMLYRIPRSLATTGMRALGRLAFFDNYRNIAAKLRRELEACRQPEKLDFAVKQTGLGLRSNRPRVYLVAGLSGGTGSGMFLDMAYVLRNQLRQLGYTQIDLVGIFVLPPVDRQPSRTQALGNAFAALTELNHFSSQGTRFVAQYQERDKQLNDPDPPYSRVIALTLPEGNEEIALRKITAQTGDFLFRELATPVGRTAEAQRQLQPHNARATRGLSCQTFGLQTLSWPKNTIHREAARKLCMQVVKRWMSKDTAPIRDLVQVAVKEQWESLQLGEEHIFAHLQEACSAVLGAPPAQVIATALAPLGSLPVQDPISTVYRMREVLSALEQKVGRPDANFGALVGPLVEPLQALSEKLTAEWGQKLSGFVGGMIDLPQLRLAGAEETVRQLIATIEKALTGNESVCKEMTSRAADAHARLGPMMASIEGTPAASKRLPPLIGDAVELMRAYPRWRYESLILQRVAATYVSLRGYLSDQLHEINFCRNRLSELVRGIEENDAGIRTFEDAGVGRNLFPSGCRTLQEAIDDALTRFTAAELIDLDQRLQTTIQEQFTSLLQICLTSLSQLKNLELAILAETEGFVSGSLSSASIAEMFVAQHPIPEDAREQLAGLLCDAAPQTANGRPVQQGELCIVALPSGPASDQILELVKQAAGDAGFQLSSSRDDIVFYREVSQLPLGDLEHVGPLGFEAYREMASIDHFTPHSRMDILEWRAASAG